LLTKQRKYPIEKTIPTKNFLDGKNTKKHLEKEEQTEGLQMPV